MKLFRFSLLFIVPILLAGAQPQPDAKIQPDAKTHTVVIRAGTLLDGKGHALHNALIVVQDGKIVRVDANAKDQRVAGAAFYDLTRMTEIGRASCRERV